MSRAWVVDLALEFSPEFDALEKEAKLALLVKIDVLEQLGPQLRRPHADTLKGSRYTNMKELRFGTASGEWRAAFAFDPVRRAVLLVAGDKTGVGKRHFYKGLIEKADQRYEAHLNRLTKED